MKSFFSGIAFSFLYHGQVKTKTTLNFESNFDNEPIFHTCTFSGTSNALVPFNQGAMGGKFGQSGGQMMEDSNRVRALEMRLSEFVSSFFLVL